MIVGSRVVVGILIVLVLLAGCGPAATDAPAPPTLPAPTDAPAPTATAVPTPELTATPAVPSEEVTFTTTDGITLAATLFGEGDVAVLLLHMGAGGATQKSWHPFARVLAERGFAALTLDFRGVGRSAGQMRHNLLIYDARAAVEFLRGRGYSRFICMGASMGGTACMRLALEVEMEGLVVLASTMSTGAPNEVTVADLAHLTMPKLFVYGTWDSSVVVNDMKKIYQGSPQPKELVTYSQAAHGTALFDTPDGDKLHRKLLDFLDMLPAVPPLSGEVIAFSSTRDGNEEIYLMDADGTGVRRLTNNPARDGWPTWSPDGSQIAFMSERKGSWKIFVLDVATGEDSVRLLTPNGINWEPAWSPDGSQIVFGSRRDGNSELYLMNPDGSNQRRLTRDPAGDGYPCWSPDGTQIAFVSARDGDWEVYIVNADGSNLRQLTANDADEWTPAWSPDGTTIAFSSERDGNQEIYLMGADGTGVRRLTNNPAVDLRPAWSPDGTRIVFYREGRDSAELYEINVDGTAEQRLGDGEGYNRDAAWRPAGDGPAHSASAPQP